jgi:hypothetical protein
MEVVAATFWRTSESRQVHSLFGAGRLVGPFLLDLSVLTEPLGCCVRNLDYAAMALPGEAGDRLVPCSIWLIMTVMAMAPDGGDFRPGSSGRRPRYDDPVVGSPGLAC